MTPAKRTYLRKLRDDGPQMDNPPVTEELAVIGYVGICIPNGGIGILPAGLAALAEWEAGE